MYSMDFIQYEEETKIVHTLFHFLNYDIVRMIAQYAMLTPEEHINRFLEKGPYQYHFHSSKSKTNVFFKGVYRAVLPSSMWFSLTIPHCNIHNHHFDIHVSQLLTLEKRHAIDLGLSYIKEGKKLYFMDAIWQSILNAMYEIVVSNYEPRKKMVIVVEN